MGICILGMGDCSSKNTTDITDITKNNTEVNNSIRNSINQNCSQAAIQSNVINIVGSKVKKLTAKQENEVQSMCILQSILKSTTNSEVINNLMSKVKDNLQSKGGVLGSPAENSTVMKKITENSSKVDNSKFNEITKQCIMNLNQRNLLNIIGSEVEDTTTDQANKAFLKCLSQHSDVTNISSSDIKDTKSEVETVKKAEGGDLGESVGKAAKGIGEGVGSAAKGIGEGVGAGIGGIVSAYMTPIIICVVILLLVSLVGSYFMMKNPQATQQLAGTASQMYQQYKM
jgi:hypothetical protein